MGLIETLQDLALSIAGYISQAVFGIVYCFLYPFQLLLYWFTTIINLVWNTFVNLFIGMWDTFDILQNFISFNLTSMIPNLWTTIILLGVIIVFVLRLYYFLKDISIFGFKI